MLVLRNKDNGNFLQRYWKSFCHAISGILYALEYEHNMIIIFVAALVVICGGFYFEISTYEWLFCIMAIGTVSAAEMINTAIEATVDLATTEIHPLAKIAKDTASSATLIFSITSLVGAIIIFLPKILGLF